MLPLTFSEDGKIGSLDVVFQDEGVPEEAWIGVPPAPDVTLSWELVKPIHGGVLGEA